MGWKSLKDIMIMADWTVIRNGGLQLGKQDTRTKRELEISIGKGTHLWAVDGTGTPIELTVIQFYSFSRKIPIEEGIGQQTIGWCGRNGLAIPCYDAQAGYKTDKQSFI